MRIDLTILQVNALRTMLADEFEDDERGWLDALEGETDAFELVRQLLGKIEDDEGSAAQLKQQMDDRKLRRDRLDSRVDKYRDAIMAVMECAGLDKLTLPEATLSLRQVGAKLVVNDPAGVPDEYTTPNPKPSMDAIKSAFSPENDNLPNWLRVEPARPSLTVRRK